jgi:hypothetical protein
MVRSLLLFFILLFGVGATLAQSTSLGGKVTDEKSEALIGASVKVLKGTDFIRGAVTDYEGNYRIPLDPGTYDVEISYTGYASAKVTGVKVLTGQLNFLDRTLSDNLTLNTVDIVAYKVPLIEQDKTSGGQTLTSDQIKNLPTRSVNAIVATTAGTTSIDGGGVNIKGSRSNATNYYIDGIRVVGSMPPVQDIEQLQVITGGLGAEYGDVTGGVISLITKGPASEYHGGFDIENSHGLDPYGWLLATGNISGPIIKKKRADGSSRTVLGFRLSGQYQTQRDDDPPALPVYRAKGDGVDLNVLYGADETAAAAERRKLADPNNVLGRMMANPITRSGVFTIPSGETLTNDSVAVFNYNPHERRQDIDITSKFDLRITDRIDVSVTGTFKDIQDQFTPGGWRLLNAQNNPTNYGRRIRGIGRFRHRLGSDEDKSDRKVSISNASYQLQFAFERGTSRNFDPRHEDRLFDYGYVGQFDFESVPRAGFRNGTAVHVGYLSEFQGFTPGSQNPGLAAYNQFANPELYSSYQALNGVLPDLFDDIWGGMHSSANLVYNVNNKSESDIMTITANSSFDLKLPKTGTHSIQFGLLNEQSTTRFWGSAPRGLWQYAVQNANSHFNGVDTSVVIGRFWDPFVSPIAGDSILQHPNLVAEQPGNLYYRALREKLGVGIDQFVNANGLTPNDLDLSMFAPRELTDQNLVNYYGYDYLGNRTASGLSFDDFFRQELQPGIRALPVAPLRPLYQGAYVKDKFTFNKMIFSLGLRVERFDLNTKVLRDQYSLYQIMSAKDYFASIPEAPDVRPASIGDDFKVYVESESDRTAKAFRSGNTWYFADGRQANDGNVIFGGGVVTPLLADTIFGDDIKSANFDPNTAFVDYTPQVNWLPRLAFSFPISDDANFFAHYDVLVQRPSSGWQVTPLDYFYFYDPGRVSSRNNANMRPERVVDYEVGFQQRLNQVSALKFSAYYREMRDMPQARTILYVPVLGSYETFDNIDFGTVKGFTVQYDLRRVKNAELRLAYTLQFADGTGSNAESQRGLTRLGNLRNLFPLDFDERHNIAGIFDYRFSEGKAYNGPRVAGKDILSNFGINMQLTAVSGRPYTAAIRPTRFGGTGIQGALNGNRLPWRFTVDARVDKGFNLSAPNKKPMYLNIYLRAANLLNRLNVQNVYPVTGSPTDDGYLATQEGASIVNGITDQGRNPEAYLASYTWVMRNPDNFLLPRRLYVGAIFEF